MSPLVSAPLPATQPPAPDPGPPPGPVPPNAPGRGPSSTVAVAHLERVQNEARLLLDGERIDAKTGTPIPAGTGMETLEGSAAVRFPDSTLIELGPRTVVGSFTERPGGGKTVKIESGTVIADVARQATGKPMVFATPHAEITVMGTKLQISVEPDPTRVYTRLEVKEGKVLLKRLADGKTVTVEGGYYAVARAGTELSAALMPIDDILIRPRDGRIAGGEWRFVDDPKAAGGKALEATPHINRAFPARGRSNYLRRIPSFALFTFKAEAFKDYNVWIRGWCMAKNNRVIHDSVAIEPADAVFTQPCPWFGPAGVNAYLFDYYSEGEGYLWVSGSHRRNGSGARAVIRFNRPGIQTVRLYAWEGPMRVGAIWLSNSRKDRPDASWLGPEDRANK